MLLSVDVDPKFEPTVCQDISRWDFRRDLDRFLRDRRPSDIVAVHASPPCREFNIALTTRPRNLRAGPRNVKTALRIIDYAEPSFWIIENPASGLLKDQAFMRKLEGYKNETCYCKWNNFLYKRPTAIWTNIPGLRLPMCHRNAPWKQNASTDGTCTQRRAAIRLGELWGLEAVRKFMGCPKGW